MADRPFDTPLPADLPEDWISGQIVAPSGADVGLSEQHGYNYLMAAVNAVQRAANAINESFDTISGKRTCRVTVGTSTAGWTQADCDYLCDGTDDQVKLSEAVAAVQEAGGGEIAILGGEYKLSEKWTLNMTATALTFSGEPGSTVMSLSAGIELANASSVQAVPMLRFSGITFDGGDTITSFVATALHLDIEGCLFRNVSVNAINYRVGNISIRENIWEVNAEFPAEVNTIFYVLSADNLAHIISGNTLKAKYIPQSKVVITLQTIGGNEGAGGIMFSDNSVNVDPAAGDASVGMSGKIIIANNHFFGVSLTARASVCVGNCVENGNIVGSAYSSSMPINGNSVINGRIVAYGLAAVTGNGVAAPVDAAAIYIGKAGSNDTPGDLAPNVTGNVITSGSIGIQLSNSMLGEVLPEKALISCNRITGCTTSIQIDSNWSGCLVTGNMIDSAVVDRGRGNLVRLNSDDAGSGGGGGTAGVSSFNGRFGAVVPATGDYTAIMVGARPDTWTPTAADVGAVPSGAVRAIQTMTQAEYDALTQKDPATLYLIKE